MRQVGFVEGQSIVIAFRWAEGYYDRLLALASELVDISVLHCSRWKSPRPHSQPKRRPQRFQSFLCSAIPFSRELNEAFAVPFLVWNHLGTKFEAYFGVKESLGRAFLKEDTNGIVV